jgi:molybdopterin molybdotransferase
LTLAENVVSPKNVPDFLQSSMDGYAIKFDQTIIEYKIVGEIRAGQNQLLTIQQDECVRIFTGASLPTGTDTVIVQEKVSVQNDTVQIKDSVLKKGDNVRAIGSEIPKDGIALEKGMRLNAASIGVMASLGYPQISVLAPPSISIIVTGDEIKKPGEACLPGQVYDASSYSIESILYKIGCKQIEVKYAKDNLHELSYCIKQSLDASDLILITGGVSVGDYDFTKQALENNGVQIVFHKVKQKPGKPVLFGKYMKKPVFGLPGNPASVLTCFYQYVYPCIGKMMGQEHSLRQQRIPILHDYSKPQGLTHFLKAYKNEEGVRILTGQESYKISSLAYSNAFVVLDGATTEVRAGQEVTVQSIPV